MVHALPLLCPCGSGLVFLWGSIVYWFDCVLPGCSMRTTCTASPRHGHMAVAALKQWIFGAHRGAMMFVCACKAYCASSNM